MNARPPRTPVRCPCGSRDRYGDCCGPLHRGRASGEATAQTAKQLMRSRFSAFAVGDVDYLLATWHRSTRPASIELDPALQWRQLEVRAAEAGGEGESHGTVEFVATFWDIERAQFGEQRERSTFRREAGQWFYVGAAR